MKKIAIILGVIQLIVAIGAIPAGISMIVNPDGSGVGIPLEVLADSPFPDYLIPGIFLLLINGLLNLVASFFSFKQNPNTGYMGLGLGLVLIIWIIVQLYFLGLTFFLQALFLLIGIIEASFGYYFILKSFRSQQQGSL